MSTTIKHGDWVIEFSDEPGRVYISNDKHPGNIHIKAEVEGYIVDIWRDSYEEVESGAFALYSDLSDMSVDDGIPTLENFVVLYRDDSVLPADPPLAFQCWAENSDHAGEQCGNAYPGCAVVWVWQGPHGTGTEAAFSDYFGQEQP